MGAVFTLLRGYLLRYRRARASELDRIAFYPAVECGERVRLTGYVDFGSEPFLIRIGSDVTIADGVRFITHDGAVRLFRDEHQDLHVYGSISVGSRVFIGINAIILKGVSIGDDSIIGTASVVTKDVPPGEVWAGVPARRIKSTEEYKRQALANATWWPVGEYNDDWRAHLEGREFGASGGR